MSIVTRQQVPPSLPDTDPQQGIDRLFAHLGTRRSGLSTREAERRLAQYGPNTIERGGRTHIASALLQQLVHPLAVLLWLAAALSWVSSNETLALAIVARSRRRQ